MSFGILNQMVSGESLGFEGLKVLHVVCTSLRLGLGVAEISLARQMMPNDHIAIEDNGVVKL
jgi:hypothetical protein